MQYNGLFWSNVVRALLALRRDNHIKNSFDEDVKSVIGKIEVAELKVEKLATLLTSLAPKSLYSLIGKSLVSYLNFHEMGNLSSYLSATKNIDEAIQSLLLYNKNFTNEFSNLDVVYSKDHVDISWTPTSHFICTQFELLFLLGLFRHIGGRRFSFHTISMQNEQQLMVQSLINVNLITSNKTAVRFHKRWLVVPSFFHSNTIKSILKHNLDITREIPLQSKILSVLQNSTQPAKINLNHIATKLDMSEAELKQKLILNGISFKPFLSQFLHDKATRHILCGLNIDSISSELGFANEEEFSLSFKEVTGVQAQQFQLLANRIRFQKGNTTLVDAIENLPPLPDNIRKAIELKDDQLTVANLASIVRDDPVFHAHVVGKANKAIFGQAPSSLEQAIGRSLGVKAVQQIAVTFAAQQALFEQSLFENVQGLTDAMLLSRSLIEPVSKIHEEQEQLQQTQLSMFGLLSLLILFHKDCKLSTNALSIWKQSNNMESFFLDIQNKLSICPFGTSSLMLSRWGLPKSLTKRLWDVSQGTSKISQLIRQCSFIAFDYIFNGADKAKMSLLNSGLSDRQRNQIADKLDIVL